MDQIRRAFVDLVATGDGSLVGDLDYGALLIAAAIDASVDIGAVQNQLDALASSIDATTVADLALALFGGAGHDPARHFAGNREHYYDQDNSMLHRVLERRLGIPIALSVLTIEVGRRLDISLHGVGMPGHFLVGSADGFIDTFNAGVLLDEAGCAQVFQRLAGQGALLPEGSLAPTPHAVILKRMLSNLAAIGADQQERRTLRAARSLLAAFPDATHREHVQHAYAAAEIGQLHEAAAAAESALVTIPEQLQAKLQTQIDQWRARLN